MAKYNVKIIRDLCIGVATCIAVAPKVFKLDAENKAVLIEGWEAESPEVILQAAQVCPTEAIIIITDEDGNQVWPPVRTEAPNSASEKAKDLG